MFHFFFLLSWSLFFSNCFYFFFCLLPLLFLHYSPYPTQPNDHQNFSVKRTLHLAQVPSIRAQPSFSLPITRAAALCCRIGVAFPQFVMHDCPCDCLPLWEAIITELLSSSICPCFSPLSLFGCILTSPTRTVGSLLGRARKRPFSHLSSFCFSDLSDHRLKS